MEEKFFTTEQVANILQVHPFTILKFIKVGKLKGLKLGRVYRIKESDVKDFIENMMTGPRQKKSKLETPVTQEIPGIQVNSQPQEQKASEQELKTEETETFKLNSPDQQNEKEKEHYYIIK